MPSQEGKRVGNEPIAIIGTACRFPGDSSSPSKLWDLLRQPRDVLSEIPKDRFNTKGFYHPNNMHHGTTDVRHSYVLSEDVRMFDAQFFGIKPVEANSIDPQQRILMETVYESLEAAGLTVSELQGSQTAVYVGLMCGDYGDMLGRDQENFPTYFATGAARSIISNRVSYFFDWHGPSMTIDTACSSSLVAVHQAVQLLRSGDGTEVAIAAGANLLLNPDQYIAESKLKMLSPDGRSRMWDDKANGYARGDGVAAVVLKTLSQAIKDNDHIECIIRETQINQDGRTKGITMPSATAQAALIRATYKKAGLDISKKSDRPQYFEAHGTGTPAGDPIEAEAIHTAFFGQDSNYGPVASDEEPLYVGSIKTVIGHTEGTAGLAAVAKASLALQNQTIPPNLLLDNVSPKVKPFYGKVQIATEARPWPQLQQGAVRRASVNSFGFGGSNAHAILEAYEPEIDPERESESSSTAQVYTPLNFSAATASSLRSLLKKYADLLDEQNPINLRDLSWTLNTRRSLHPLRTSVYGITAKEISQRLRSRAEADEKALVEVQSKTLPSKPRVLGVFTGQGAQWARMGAEFLVTSPIAASILDDLERSLSELPDGPDWSLKDEILAEGKSSRVSEAAISQPLCTAVQILLVDLLSSAGINFVAVVGHSSGEMGAAYAAGYLSAGDAIRIAYYRGYHLHLAGGPNGETGSMMAVGISFEDAQELCDLPAFKGHINIAASNSFASVTLSGDTSSINWAKDVFDDEKKFARLLKVDKAYHSHHMMACSDSYRKSLAACKIKVLRPTRSSAAWISSVFGEDAADHRDILKDEYWVQNMVSPVMFSQALEFAAAEKGPFDVVVECGPHPALKGPALQVLQEVLGESPPYTGVLSRGKNDKQAFAEGLGFLWQALGDKVVDFLSFDKFLNGPGVRSPKLLPALPTYAWDHERIFWHESRQSASNRTKSDPTHEILGMKCPDGMEHQLRWRNMIRPKEIPWLSGHQIQGQMVFPAAGYISAALEAVDLATPGEELKMIEIEDFVIGQAIVFNDEYASVETQFTLTNVSHGPNSLTADFSFYSASTKDPMSMGLNASGKISVEIGEHQEDLLPAYPVSDFNMIDVESDRFHDSLSELGFGYTGPFRALESLQRKLGQATGNIRNPASTDPAYDLMVHPATLDSSIQAIILAYCYPNDGRLWSVHLPTSIRKIKVNPSLCNLCAGQEVKLRFRSAITSERSSEIEGDVDIYLEHGQHAMLQLEGLHTKPLANATSANDSPLFLETVWDVGRPNREASALKRPNLDNQAELSFDIERVAHYYLRKLDIEATKADRENTEWHHKIFFEYIDHTLASVQDGTARFAKKEWIHDTLDEIQSTISKYPDSIDMKLMRAVGEHLLPVIRGETTMLEYMTEDNMLNEFYVSAVGFPEYTNSLAEQVSKFGHRFPHMNVLEIGAGTGGATKHIMKQLDKKFGSYTYTDISTGFFEKAKDVFQEYASKMTFKALNIEKDTSEQGFPDQSYDLVIASLVLHATHEMEVTMRNVRRLLKPGGHLVMLEFVDHEQMRSGLIFGPLPGWWMGYDDGRKLSPCISEKEWDDCLRKTGFAGVDAIVPRQPTLPISLAVLICQALDDRVSFLRSPLAPSTVEIKLSNLTIIGGATERTKQIIDRCIDLLKPFYSEVTAVVSLADLNSGDVPFMGTILSLTDLDESIFEHMTTEKLNGARQLFQQSKSCLWITQGSRADNPYQNMSVGFGRTINLEMAHLRIQFLDFASADEPMAELIAETLLQFEATDLWDQNGEGQNLLWSVEPEIAYENGNLLVPRLMPSPTRNLRYNSIRRRITKDIDPKSARLSLCWTGQSYEVCDDAASDERVHSKGNIECQVTYSTLQAIKVTNVDYAYLVLGTNVTTQEQIIALTPHRHSIIQAPEKWTIPCHGTTETGLRIMSLVQNYLVALTTLESFSNGDSIVLLEPKEGFASILFALASQKGINLICLTTNDPGKSPYWIPIHPNAPKRDMKAALPRNVSCFFQSSDNERLNATIIKCLPSSCKIRGVEFFMSEDAKIDPHSSAAFIPLALRSAWIHAHHDNSSHAIEEQSVISTPNILPQTRRIGEPTVFFWSETPTIPVQTLPVDAKPMFSSDKTYWLVGLTGGLGLSLCEWMVKHGAKYIVITSRNPNIEPRWEEHMRIQGAVIKIHKNDITDRESVRAVYKKICDELPPIAGVAQGAMVLADTMFVDMDIERVQKVLRPKVNGSIYLDEIFSTTKLEFFVFFSSMAYVTGSKGQSIYAAANAYMTSLAARRRKHGLAGSAINIGTILGNGYVTRELTLAQQDYLRRVGNVFMSEQDFHQIFAEAVVAGGESSSDIPEIMTGLRLARMDDEEKMTWFHNPKFSHCVLQPEGNDGKHVVSNQTISVKAQLLTATDADEVRSIVEESFLAKLKSTLQTDPSISILHMHTEELGIDSLVAVDLRSWFIKEMSVEMPVLKILGGGTVAELIIDAVEKLPTSLIPNIGKEVDPSSKIQVKSKPSESDPATERNPIVMNDERSYDESEEEEEAMVQLDSPTFDQVQKTSTSSVSQSQDLVYAKVSRNLLTSTRPKSVSFDGRSTPSLEVESDVDSAGSSYDGNTGSKSYLPPRSIISNATSVSISNEGGYLSKFDDEILERAVPMSFGQSRFWFLKFYLDDPTTFNITTSIRLNGSLDIDRFGRAVKFVGQRHEALRTSFFIDKNDQPMQGVLRRSILTLEHKRINDDADIASEYARIKGYTYDFGRGETMRIVLLSLSDTLHQLIIGYHHINMDGISLEVLLADLQQVYDKKKIPPVVAQYPDFSLHQRTEHARGQWHKEIDFWKSEFADVPPPLPILPITTKTVRSSLTKYSLNTSKFHIDQSISAQIQNACRKTKTSPFHFFLAAFKTLLFRYCSDGQGDICIGMADSGRNDGDVSDSIGFFLNLLPLRFRPQPSQNFNDALKEARSKVVAALVNSKVPFDVLLGEIDAPRSSTYNPLFQAFINYRQNVQDKRIYCGCESEATQFDGSQTAYDITIDIIDNPGGETVVVFAGQSDLYSQSNVETLASSYFHLLKAFAKYPAARLRQPALHDAKSTQNAIDLGRGPMKTYNWPETLIHRIDEMVQAHGSRIALKTSQQKLTYLQMSQRVNLIASTLKSHQIGEGSRVGVFQDPNVNLYCSLLAVLRVGAVFVPLEPRLTLPRLAAIIEDSALDAVLYDKANQKEVSALGSSFKKINVSSLPARNSVQVSNSAKGDRPAIILYTSGSTGKPKGILFDHSAWRNQIESASDEWVPKAGPGVHLQQSSWSFDISFSQTFLALANGATLFFLPKEQRGDPLAISKAIASEGVTFTQATPWEYVSWLGNADTESLQGSKWQFAMTGGESMTQALITEFRKLGKRDLRLVNAYGPAEITVSIGSVDIDYHRESDLHKPVHLFPNYSVYVLDSKMEPVPVGVPGEIYISGAGVAQGYLNNEALNEDRFLLDDFAPAEYLDNKWLKMHRSGDRGRLSADGALILEGRVDGDTQIKFGGIRIDLRDIESTITRHSNGTVKGCIVSVRSSGSFASEFLVAHVVTSANSGHQTSSLEKLRLSLPLPQYMQPSMMIPLDRLPTNSSDKVDRKSIANLPLPQKSNPKVSTTLPGRSSETRLKELWEQLLGDTIVGHYAINSNSNFFHVGGSSLALMKLQNLVKSTFNIEIPLVQLFENPTLGAMARIVDPNLDLGPTDNTGSLAADVMQQASTASSGENIDWVKETSLTDDLYNFEINTSPKDIDLPFKTVILTGSTGFLGKALLTQMIEDRTIEKIYAIAVRKTKSELPAIFSDPKVEVHFGNLALPRLGLSEEVAEEIFSLADAVVHNGADVSFLKTYRTLAKTNVDSTRELVKLCLPNEVALHFISSASVAHLSGKESFGEESVAAFGPPTDGSDGYTATKWASERFLELVAEKFSMPIWIHRPSSVTGEDAPALDLMSNLLKYSKKLRMVPTSPAWRGGFDFVSVELVAQSIIDELHGDKAQAISGVKYVYESGELEISVGDMQGALERETGEEFVTLSVQEWSIQAERAGMDGLVATYLKAAAETPIVFPKLVRARQTKVWGAEDRARQPPPSTFSFRGVLGGWFGM